MEYAKSIWLKYINNQELTDEELVDGARMLKELARDMAETDRWASAAKEAAGISDKLVEIAKERGIVVDLFSN